ncbi:MAG: BrnA antitoxin family protein [Gammaproteobacteria bacterium]|nr:BrnA antitoxin family protein [Gammaproteobacteria bacterium]
MRDEYDFSDAKRAKDVPYLAQLQAEAKDKTAITLMLDNDVFNRFRIRAEAEGLEYQVLINCALREAIAARPIDEQACPVARENPSLVGGCAK